MMYYRPSKETDKKWIWIVLIIVFVVVGILYTRTGYVGKVSGFSWEHVFKVEKYQTVTDSGWSLPAGAFNVSSYSKVHHHDDIYEYRTEYRNGKSETKRVKVGRRPVYRTYYEYHINRWEYAHSLTTNGKEKHNLFWPEFVAEKADSRGLGATRIAQRIEKLSVFVKWSVKDENKADFFTVNSYQNIVVGDVVTVHYILGMPTGNLTFEPKAEAVD